MDSADKTLLLIILLVCIILLGRDLSNQTRLKIEYKNQLIELQNRCSKGLKKI